jgi:pimeloyl-ACP methyl ester carboxylesterase
VWPRHAASDSDMKPGTWRSFDMDGQEIPAMVIKQPFRDRPSCNWLSLPGTQKPANTLLVFHAAGLSLEFYYQELEKLSHMFNVRIVAVEYPGFGKRSRTSCTSESSLQARYPREVLRFCEQDLDDFAWDQTVVWSVCFGCSIGMSFLSYLLDPDTPFAETNDFDARRRMPNAVFLSKVFVSYRHCLRNVAWNRDTPLSRMPPKNMFAILPYSVGGRQVDGVPDWVAVAYRRTTCPVVISTGEQDTLCTVEDAQAVYDQFVNASWRRLNVTPGNHSDSFLEIASHEVTAFGSKRELQRLQNE